MSFIKSPVYRRFFWTLFIGLLIGVGTWFLGFLPYDDALQGAWAFFSAVIAATIAFKKRVAEDDAARYRRVAHKAFNYWVNKNPELVQGLFSSNFPYAAIRWFKDKTGCDILQCDNCHVIDSLSQEGQEPGQLLFYSGIELGKVMAQNEGKPLNEVFSKKFAQFAVEWKKYLGEEIAPGVFFKEIKKGDHRPAGVHICNQDSKCLVVLEYMNKGREFGKMATAAFSFKKDYLEEVTDQDWIKIKDIVYKYFPYFEPSNAGSGPQKKHVPLFLQLERSLTEDEVKKLPDDAIKVYNEVMAFIETLKKPKEDKEEESSS